MHRSQAGFTLIEIIVVIAAIAMLSSMIVPLAGRVLEDAKLAKAEGELKAIATSAIKYKSSPTGGSYPWPTSAAINDLSIYNTQLVPYLDKRIGSDPWNTAYKVRVSSDGGSPAIFTHVVYSWGPDRADDYNGCSDANKRDKDISGCKPDDVVVYVE